MPTLTPVDIDPFADTKPGSAPVSSGPKLTPVDHDPFAAGGQAPAAKPDYAGWDTAPTPQAAPSVQASVPMQDEPGYQYGQVLPYRVKTDQQGKPIQGTTEWGYAPEMIRAPVRGIIEGGQEARGIRPGNDPATRNDISAAVGALGGARAGVGEPAPGPVAASPIRPAAVEARQVGYVLPPSSISEKPGLVSSALAGWSGKIKTAQAASAHNQEITNNLASEALGVPKGTVLTDEVFNGLRKQASQKYQNVISAVPSVTADNEFKQAVSGLGGQNSQAAQAFPKITNNPGIADMVGELNAAGEHPTAAWVELVKELRFNATSNLKAIGDPSKHALGLAQREAATAVDDMMERQITAAGNPQAVAEYQQARKLIAKSYDVESVTNPATGDVNARGLAKLADKGRPLTDQLSTIARAASAFPKAMTTPSSFGDNEPWSALDFFGSAAAMAHGNPGVAGAILGRPAARATILSGKAQDWMTNPSIPPPMQILPFPENDSSARSTAQQIDAQ
jgi:hypothetical protein